MLPEPSPWTPCSQRGSEIEILDLACPLHDELETRADVLAEQVIDDAVGLQGVVDRHLEAHALVGIQRRGLQLVGRHLAQPLEAHDVGLGVALGLLPDDAVPVRLVERPVRLLADLHLIKGRLGDVHGAALDERAQVPVEEGEQQRGDVVAVAVGVHEQEDAAVAQLRQIEVRADATPQGADDVLELLVGGHLVRGGLLRVEHLAAQGEDGLGAPVPSLLGAAACGVALDEEQLAGARLRGGAVGELARQVQPVAHRRLAAHRLGGGAAGLARAGGQDDARHGRLADGLVVVEPLLQRRPQHAVHLGRHLGVVEPPLGLPLELRLHHVAGEDGGDALADVLRGEGDALGAQVVRFDVVAHRLHHRAAQARLVRAALRGGDAVDVGADVLVRGLRPHQRGLQAHLAVARVVEDGATRGHHRLVALGHDLVEVLGDAPVVLVRHRGGGAGRLVLPDDRHALVQVALGLQALADELGIELQLLAEDLRIRLEGDGRAGAARRALHLQRGGGLAAGIVLHVALAFAFDLHEQLARQRVHHGAAHAVQTARVDVVALLELAARVQRGEDDLHRGLLELGHDVHGDAAPVVHHGDGAAVLVERDFHGGGVAVDDLVHRVVEDLPQQVVIARAVSASDVHGRALAHRLQALEDLDVRTCVRFLLRHDVPRLVLLLGQLQEGDGPLHLLHRVLAGHLVALAAPARHLVLRRAQGQLAALLRLERDGRVLLARCHREELHHAVPRLHLDDQDPLARARQLVHLRGPAHRRVGALRQHRQEILLAHRLHADDLIPLARLGVAAARARGDLHVPLQREAQAQPILGDGHQLLRPGQPGVQRQRADNPLAVVELEQLLHRVPVASGGRHVVEAGDVGGAEVAEEHQVRLEAARQHRHHRVALAQARGGRVLHLAHALDPPVAREHDVCVLVHDEGVLAELHLLGARAANARAALVVVGGLDLRQLVLDGAPQLALVLEDALDALHLQALLLELLLDDEDLQPGQLVELHLQDGVHLDFIQLEARHQLLGRVLLALGRADDADHLVQRVVDLLEALQDVDALLQLAQLVLEALGHHLEAEVEEVLEDALEIQPLGRAHLRVVRGHQAGEVHAEVRLQGRVLVEVRHHQLGAGVALELQHDAHLLGGLVAHVQEQRQLPLAHQVANLGDQGALVHRVGNGGDDDLLAALLDVLQRVLAADADAALARLVDLPQLGLAVEDLPAGGEVRTLHELHQVLHREVAVLDERRERVAQLAQVVGRDVGGHAHGDARGAVHEQLRQARGDDDGLGQG
ncbi:conserved hypothetical protein, partial [Stigmatella aurantiaca DW4/3-1]